MKPLSFLLLILILFAGCEKKPAEKEAPEIPPVETMFIDFGELTNIDKSVDPDKTHWVLSATTVSAWNLVTWSALAVPVAALKAAVSQQPEVINDVTWTWQWKYSVEVMGSEYTARLVGQLETASKMKWEMYISKSGENPFEDFLWFEGTSETSGNSGTWTLYHSPEYPDKVLEVEWKKEGDQVGEITYSYVRKLNNLKMPDKFNGSTLTFGLKEGNYDAYLHLHLYDLQTASFNDTDIEWNRSDYSGRIKAEHYFNDTQWHCWNQYGINVDCTE